MLDYCLKFNTGGGEGLTLVTECKLLFTNLPCKLCSVELFCDEILADLPYRLVRTEQLALFDARLLPALRLQGSGGAACDAIAYSFRDGECRFISTGEYSASAYAAALLALFYHGEVAAGEAVRVISPERGRSAAVTEGGVLLFD